MRVFISYHREDTKYKNRILEILKENSIEFYCVPEDQDFNGWAHEQIADFIRANLKECDVLLCIVGRDTYSRPHVDNEIHFALKGEVGTRKGIVAVMLENRQDSKNNIDVKTFPIKLSQNMEYIILEQFASLKNNLVTSLKKAKKNSNNPNLQTNHSNKVMKLRSGKYYDTN